MLPSRLFYENMLDDLGTNHRMDCDIYEKDGEYHVVMDLPGYKKEDINIECHRGTITVKASYQNDENNHDKKYVCRERHFGKMERSFYLGDIDEDSIKASFNNGTLSITIKENKNDNKKLISID